MSAIAVALIIATGPILAALIPLWVAQRRTAQTVTEVHQMVNSQHDEQLRYQAELSAVIRGLGGTVPDQDPPPTGAVHDQP